MEVHSTREDFKVSGFLPFDVLVQNDSLFFSQGRGYEYRPTISSGTKLYGVAKLSEFCRRNEDPWDSHTSPSIYLKLSGHCPGPSILFLPLLQFPLLGFYEHLALLSDNRSFTDRSV